MVQDKIQRMDMIVKPLIKDSSNLPRNFLTKAVTKVAMELLDKIEAVANFQELWTEVRCLQKRCFPTMTKMIHLMMVVKESTNLILCKALERDLVVDLQHHLVDKQPRTLLLDHLHPQVENLQFN
jgi:hypothetical protein